MGDWIIRLIDQSGYLGVGFLMFLETVFPPIPSELIMPLGGVAAAQGRMSLTLAIAAGTAGAMLGNIVWYLAARALGHDRLRPIIRRYGKWLTLNWKEVERAHDWFERHGIAFVLLGRLIPTVRSLVSIPAGLLDMRFRNFVIASTIGTGLWTTFLAVAGYKLRENFADIDQVLSPISNGVIVVLVVAYGWRLLTHKVEPDA
ncbi:DedA family protein [Sphingomonas hankyongi]|uniref:DedA family protein n=1 Tax=Sphingomonas hankyongi TaxID=2908209 RepID=A0ABT0RYH1_9SPHN|nr:DedA family protein [Sphingomonas hankyongi]MCL6728494.1 DedA family protein [Sphingomonas hankyongi]